MATLGQTFRDEEICIFAKVYHEHEGDEDVLCTRESVGKHFCLGKCEHYQISRLCGHPREKQIERINARIAQLRVDVKALKQEREAILRSVEEEDLEGNT